MGTVIAGNSDYPYGDMYTSNSNHFHSNTLGVNGAIPQQGSAASARSGGRLSSSCVQAVADIHNMDVYDAYMEMGSRSSTSSSVEAQELAEVLRGILDDDSDQLLCPAAKHDLPAPLPKGHLIPLANPFNFLHSPDHHHESPSLHSSQHYSDFDHDEGLPNHEQLTNPIPNCMSSTCGDALLSDLSLLDYDNHHFDVTNHGSISSATCCQPMYHHLDGFTVCGINGGEEANYGLSSSLSQGATNHEVGGVDDHGALQTEAEICSGFFENVPKGSIDHAPINACKEELHMQLGPQAYQMVCDHDGLYPSGMPMMQREAMYAAAAMQPVDWAGILAGSAGTRPKRRNVRISHDPQTASARRRRERISDRIRVLQRLVPGGTKMDTASMLDEAIQYLKFLKSQVQALQWLERSSSPLSSSSSSSSSSSCFYPSIATTSLLNPRLIK